MRLKKGVKVRGIQNEIQVAMQIADSIWKEYGYELVVTSISDGEHKYGSKHYRGDAFDGRIRYFPKEQHSILKSHLQKELGDEFDVVLHSTHIHVEFDPKGLSDEVV